MTDFNMLDRNRFRWSDELAVRAGDRIASLFENAGIRLDAECRIMQARRIVERSRGLALDFEAHGDFLFRLAEGHRTILEFLVIAEALNHLHGADQKRISLATAGKPLLESMEPCQSRDAQFELLVASLVHHTGIRDVSIGEPDIRIAAGDRAIGIAVKRVTSAKQLEKRIRHAAKQVERGNDLGVIAVSVDAIVAKTFYATKSVGSARDVFHSSFDLADRYVRRLASGKYVAAIYAFGVLIGWEETESGPAMAIEILWRGHWVGPSEDHAKMEQFLAARGEYCRTALLQLVSRV